MADVNLIILSSTLMILSNCFIVLTDMDTINPEYCSYHTFCCLIFVFVLLNDFNAYMCYRVHTDHSLKRRSVVCKQLKNVYFVLHALS